MSAGTLFLLEEHQSLYKTGSAVISLHKFTQKCSGFLLKGILLCICKFYDNLQVEANGSQIFVHAQYVCACDSEHKLEMGVIRQAEDDSSQLGLSDLGLCRLSVPGQQKENGIHYIPGLLQVNCDRVAPQLLSISTSSLLPTPLFFFSPPLARCSMSVCALQEACREEKQRGEWGQGGKYLQQAAWRFHGAQRISRGVYTLVIV